MSRISGQIAVVIGGHDGIGGALARRFAVEGAMVYATGRSADDGEAAHGLGTLRTGRVDASDVTALKSFFATVSGEAGALDVLVVSAGLSEHGRAFPRQR